MAGSFPHLIAVNGGFRWDLIENMGEAREALADCFVIIHTLAGGDLNNVRRVVDLYIPGIVHNCRFANIRCNDSGELDGHMLAGVDEVHPEGKSKLARDVDSEIAAASKIVETLEPLSQHDRVKTLGAIALIMGHYGIASQVIDELQGGD